MNTAPIPIFRAGRHLASNGQWLEFSAETVAAIAKAYDPAVYEAPFVVGHPKTDDPAYGWVDSVAVGGDGVMSAAPKQIDPAFAAGVQAGRYKRVSASFFAPDAANNPKPGQFYLRHVGFLGAAEPGVKGLGSVQFAADDQAVTVEFAAGVSPWTVETVSRLFRRVREWLIGEKGLDVADGVLPSWEVDSINDAAANMRAQDAVDAAAIPNTSAFAAGVSPVSADGLTGGGSPAAGSLSPDDGGHNVPNAELKKQADDLAAREAAVATAEKALADRAAEFAAGQAKTEAATLVDDLVKQGKVLPAQRDGLVEFAAMCHRLPAQDCSVSFSAPGEGGAQTEIKKSPFEFLAEYLKAGKPVVPLGEAARTDASFAAPDTADPVALAGAAVAFQAAEGKAGRAITIEAAIDAVKAGKA